MVLFKKKSSVHYAESEISLKMCVRMAGKWMIIFLNPDFYSVLHFLKFNVICVSLTHKGDYKNTAHIHSLSTWSPALGTVLCTVFHEKPKAQLQINQLNRLISQPYLYVFPNLVL